MALGQVFPEYPCQFYSTNTPLLGKIKKLIIFITGLHNKPQGCGASVASATGPFTTKRVRFTVIRRPVRSTTHFFLLSFLLTTASSLAVAKIYAKFPSFLNYLFSCQVACLCSVVAEKKEKNIFYWYLYRYVRTFLCSYESEKSFSQHLVSILHLTLKHQ
jgi:hypothetical protein